MPKSYPPEPIFQSEAERQVWEALMSQLSADAIVICNLQILEIEQIYETDFIIAWPDLGVAVVEVKGGKLTPNEDDTFYQLGRDGPHKVDPMRQAVKNLFAIKKYIQRKSSVSHFSARPHIVLPYSEIPSSYSRPTIPRSVIHDDLDMHTLVSRIERDVSQSSYRPTALELHGILKILGQTINAQKTIMELVDTRESTVTILTERQNQILDLCKAMPRFSVLGAAGCGKTFVAIEQARRRAKAGDRVLFLCYNRGLADYLNRRFSSFPEVERPTMVSTLQSLTFKLNLDIETKDEQIFWDVSLPQLLIEALEQIDESEKFDCVIIDEAQDFHPEWWKVVEASLKDRSNGKIYAFGDQRQGIFRHATDIPLTPAALHLDTNMRNSLPISKLASLCVDDALNHAGLDGPPVQFRECTTEQAIEIGDSVIQELLNEGWKAQDICLLTTGSRHPKHREIVDRFGKRRYWETFYENEVFFGHVLGFKGLERPVVVLILNGWKIEESKKDVLYTGITRARDRLIICGSEEELRHAGGKEFMKALR